MNIHKSFIVSFFTILFLFFLLLLPDKALAGVDNGLMDSPQQTGSLTTNLEESVGGLGFFERDLGVFITNTVKIGMIVGSIIALLFLIWGAIDWITSGGDKAKYEAARDKITAAIFGLGLLASAFVIWMLVNYFFGIDKAIIINPGTAPVPVAPDAGPAHPGP